MSDSKLWHVYVLECGDGSFYTGITTDVKRRVHEHRLGKGAKYTVGRGPITLLESVAVDNRSQALRLEYRVKQAKKGDKLEVLRCGLE